MIRAVTVLASAAGCCWIPRPSALACMVWVMVCIAWVVDCWPCKICCSKVSRPSYWPLGCAGCGAGCGAGCVICLAGWAAKGGTCCGIAGFCTAAGVVCVGLSMASISALVYPAMARAAFSLIFNVGRLHNNVSVMGQALNYLVFVAFGDGAHGATLPRVGIIGPVTVIAQAQTGAQFSQQKCTFVCERLGKNDITVHADQPFLMSSKATRISVIAAVFSLTTVLHWYHISRNAAIGKPTLEIA
nr:MAG TPA: hypothetical protein [Caudoviricetes sp.]